MSAKRGWIGEPQPARQWHESHYSREADRIRAAKDARGHTDPHLTGQPALQIAPRYANGRPRYV